MIVMTSLILIVGLTAGQDVMKVSPLQRVMPGTSVELMCEVNISEVQRRLEGETFNLKWSREEEGETLAVVEVTRGMEVLEEQAVEEVRMESVREEQVMQWNMIIDNVFINHTGLYECKASIGQEVLALKHTLLVVLSDEESDLHQTTFTFTKKGGELSLDCSDLEGDGREADWTKPGSGNINKMIVSPSLDIDIHFISWKSKKTGSC